MTSNAEEFKYKKVKIKSIKTLDAVEFSLKENNINSNADFIEKVSQFLEYVGFARPRNIIINHTKYTFSLNNTMKEFIEDVVLEQFFEYSAKDVFIMSDQESLRMHRYLNRVHFCVDYECVRKCAQNSRIV